MSVLDKVASRGVRLVLATVLGAVVVASVWVPGAQAADNAKLVLVLDSSGSMAEKIGGDTKISVAKKALNTVVDGLPSGAQVGLRVYGATVFDRSDQGACTDSQLVVPIGTDNRGALKDEIKKYKPYGETPISYSLKQAAGDLGGSGKRTVVLVSDGEETCNVDPCDTAQALADQGVDLKFDVIGLRVSGKARSQLQCIADKGNGTYYDADNAEQIEDSLDKLATRAFRPFKLTGTPVKGGPDKTAGTSITPGQYVDTIPKTKDTPLYYRVPRTIPGSTIHVGFTAEAAGFVPTVYLHTTTTGGLQCGDGIGQVANVAGTRNVVSAETSSWKTDPKSACNTDPEVVVDVSSFGTYLAGRKFELLIQEEPPVTDLSALPEGEPEITWEKMSAGSSQKPPVPGSNLSDAPTIESGTYATSILTGEKQVFAVNLDWGQRLQVQAVVAPRTGALASALSVSDTLDAQVLGSMRGEYRSLSVRGLPTQSSTMGNDAETYRVSETTPTIRYLNRDLSGANRYAALPGPQYVVLSKSRTSSQEQFLVPYTLIVKVIGTAGEGAPAYATPATPTPTPADSTQPSVAASPGTTPPEDDSGVSVGVAVAVGAGALLLGAAAAAVAFALRRRRPKP